MDKPLAEVLSAQEPKVIQTMFELLEVNSDTHLAFEGIACNLHDCESPIEKMLMVSLMLKGLNLKNYYLDVWCQYDEFNIKENYRCDLKVSIDNVANITPDTYDQTKFAEVLIECDGHDFHEKTKAQVENRNKRDLVLKRAGYDILHFSGSQIFKNPSKCADEIIEYLIIKAEGKNNGKRS